VVQIDYSVNIEGLDNFNFIKYYHIKLKTVAVDYTKDSSFDILLDFKGFNIRAFELKLEARRVSLHVVDRDGVVGHG
jgi:hypothetical protein